MPWIFSTSWVSCRINPLRMRARAGDNTDPRLPYTWLLQHHKAIDRSQDLDKPHRPRPPPQVTKNLERLEE